MIKPSLARVLAIFVVVFQLLSLVWLFATLETAACQASLSFSARVCSNSCPSIQWCHPTISSSVTLFSRPQFFQWVHSSPSGNKSNWSFSFSTRPSMNIQGWFPLALTGLISLPSKDSQESSLAPQFESSHIYFLFKNALTLIYWGTFLWKLFKNWSVVDVQCCVGFWWTARWFSFIYIIHNILVCIYNIVFHYDLLWYFECSSNSFFILYWKPIGSNHFTRD